MSFMAVEKGVGLIGLEAIQIHSTGGRTRATPVNAEFANT